MPSYRTISISELTPGGILATPIFDSNSAKLLDADSTIDRQFIERLESLGITDVFVDSAAEQVVKPPINPLSPGVRAQAVEGRPANAVIDRCSYCGATIHLQPPTPNSKASAWRCKSCGAVYFGRDDGGPECQGVTRGESNVSPFTAPPDVKGAPLASSVPPENVRRLIRSLVPGEFAGPERRMHKRYPVTVPVTVVPLASDFRIDGEPVQMTTSNVSLGGAALIHTRFIDAPYLVLDFTVAGVELVQVVLQVLRVRGAGPVYEVAGQFISRLSKTPK